METKLTRKETENKGLFLCNHCYYYTSRLYDFNKHKTTRKHQFYEKGNQIDEKGNQIDEKVDNIDNTNFLEENVNFCYGDDNKIIYKCSCNKLFKNRSGLWKHKKLNKCSENDVKENIINENEVKENDVTNKLILKIFEENNNLVSKLANDNTELQNIIKEMLKNGLTNNSHNTNNITNTNSNNNNTFNLQVYLNETCKNAMNLSEFIEQITPTLEELELTGRVGYAKGISTIVLTRLDQVNKNDQPIHCTDGKREVLYIKENNVWNKEEDDKPLLTKAIKMVSHKNLCNISEWQKMYPDCTNSESRKNDTYLRIVLNSMPGSTKEETTSNYDKIITAVAKHTVIDK
jgi:hypothetical protein